MLVEMVVHIWNLVHWRFSGLKADLLKDAHFVCGLVLQNKSSVRRNGSVPTGESVCELPPVDAPRQHPPKCTSVQSR